MEAPSAIVTGGSSGIGLAIARALGEEGYELALAGRDQRKLDEAVANLSTSSIHAIAIRADVGNEADVHELVRAHRTHHSALDVLVNSAGVSSSGRISDTTTATLDESLTINLRSVQLVTRECVPLLKRAAATRGTAHIINLSSIVGKNAAAGAASYSAAKAGVISLTQAMHSELAAAGIRATALCPSYVDTPMSVTSGLRPDEMIQPEDLAHAVRFLLHTSKACVIPEIVFQLPGDRFSSW